MEHPGSSLLDALSENTRGIIMNKRTEQEITEMANSATAGWCCTNSQRMAAAIRGYKLGYKQAEQDLALTIEDIELLHTFLYAVKNNKQGAFTFTRLSDEQYEEVLRRFREIKDK